MKTEYLSFDAYNAKVDPYINEVRTELTFDVFVKYLQDRILKEKPGSKKPYLEEIAKIFVQRIHHGIPVTKDNFRDVSDLFDHINSSLLPPISDENELLWGITSPLGRDIYYGTPRLYEFIESNKNHFEHVETRMKTEIALEMSSFIYALVLRKFYHVPQYPDCDIVFSYHEESTGLLKYVKFNIDNRFVDVKVNGDLPVLDSAEFRFNLPRLMDAEKLSEVLPLRLFTVCGFSVISVKDVTATYTLQNLKKLTYSDSLPSNDKVSQSLKTLVNSNEVDFSLLPFIKLNNKVVFDIRNNPKSILLTIARSKKKWRDNLDGFIEDYKSEPKVIVMESEPAPYSIKYNFLLEGLSELELTYYALIPVFHNQEVVGLLEVFSKTLKKMDRENVGKGIAATYLLSQIIKTSTDKFEKQINQIISEKFTYLQPSVQWKFNEVALEYLQKIEPHRPKPLIGTVQFEHVFPLCGAIDIRNSTLERNRAAALDLEVQLKLLIDLFTRLRPLMKTQLDEKISECKGLLAEVKQTPMDEIYGKISDYMGNGVKEVLAFLKGQNAEAHALISEYEEAVVPETGLVFSNRRALEESIDKINSTVNMYLDFFNEEIQSNYPCYFEKYRTDGIEYDIYIGQSIAPGRKFNQIYLDNIRLWQLTSMASIARLTHHLIPQMKRPLTTTQLIFVVSTPIDIVFRSDERRFDVEGAYNIRYYIIKKRIDKVLIKDTDERLTQPGKIALVYINPKDIKEYRVYISYLQQKGMLLDDLEEVELEELQGVSGLKALRVGVNVALTPDNVDVTLRNIDDFQEKHQAED